MAKSYKHKQIEMLCKKIAIMRAKNCCEICKKEWTEGHHIFFGSQYLNNLHLTFNPLFYAALCGNCHREQNYSPHGPQADNEEFLEILQEKLLTASQTRYVGPVSPENRWKAISAILTAPIDTDFVSVDLKAVHKDLVDEYEALREVDWYDDDIQPEHGRAG